MKQFIVMIALAFSLFATGLSAEMEQVSSDPSKEMTSTSININTADAKSLADALDGVGEVKAKAIVTYREANGAFSSAQDLGQVQGVGPATIASNREVIVVQ